MVGGHTLGRKWDTLLTYSGAAACATNLEGQDIS